MGVPSVAMRTMRLAEALTAQVLLVFSCVLVIQCSAQDLDQSPALGISTKSTKCYDEFFKPQRCIPEFENAAFNVQIEATNTCGDNGRIEYCVQTGSSGKKSCDYCQPGDHSSAYLTDLHNRENQTWWQSETMYEGIQFPSQVNLTMHFGKSFDITYVRIWFYSPRPESFSIYKRAREDGPWIPYQFYSATCRDTYHLPDSVYPDKGEETRAFCTSEYSDISPLRDGNVAFSTLEHRPSAIHFDTSVELQDWVQATDLRIVLDRVNTFGDEVFGDQHVLRSYFYAISDVAVGARCTCNGHASRCVTSTSQDGSSRRVCQCDHKTTGPDCNECLPFYNDAPWGRASIQNAHECKPCNCNGFSNRCFFDKELYARTGHGGHCLDCEANRDGPNCERCRENYYQREDHYCIACNCNPVGSRSLQCNSEGRCQCKTGVTGEKCDRCDLNFWDFGQDGCKPCACSLAGSFGNTPTCDSNTGICRCKDNVEGRKCQECKPGFFNIDTENEFGCTPCFCFGHSSECSTAAGYSQVALESLFTRSSERWTAQTDRRKAVELQYNALTQRIGVSAQGYETIYFHAPDRYLGDQRSSYNRDLKFTMSIGEYGPNPTASDIILEGSGSYVTNTIFAQNNPLPSTENQVYTFRLHEHPDYGWQPRMTARAFMSILTNLTAIRIRGTYKPLGVGFLDDVQLNTALRGAAGQPANWIERCECPHGYIGQFCESCAPRFRHSPALGGPFMPCIPCDCNKHADHCDAETGRCICHHNTAGDNCELCARGYYGNALEGTQTDCKPCLCPGDGACMLLHDETVVCLECPEGYAGPRCDLCSDGYFGDPTGKFGPMSPCKLCDCNQNIDKNAVGNCNRTTGECLKCIHYTGGAHCDQCLPGFYGDALGLPKGDCQRCMCYRPGTEESEDTGDSVCDQSTGKCRCRPYVRGHNCDKCENGYFNILSGQGCEACNCDTIGSMNSTCDLQTGQCYCRPGITGLRCDQCEPNKYGFSVNGCQSCDCDPTGSKNLQCHLTTGQCSCWDNVEGRKCDRCKENKHDRYRGCRDCPDCYNLVQEKANMHLEKLKEFEQKINEINSSDVIINAEDFDKKLREVQDAIQLLLDGAKEATAGKEGKTLIERMNDIKKKQEQIEKVLTELEDNIKVAEFRGQQGLRNVTEAEETIERARKEINNALDVLHTDGMDALEKARERARDMGQQSAQMTKFAQEARERVHVLEDHAKNIEEIAKQAKNISTQAHELYKKTNLHLQNNSDEIFAIENEINELEKLHSHVKDRVSAVHQDAVKSENETISFFNDVNNLNILKINASEIKANAAATYNESQRIIKETRLLMDENEELIEGIREKIQQADDLLQEGEDHQNEVAEFLSEVDVAFKEAEEAVKLGDSILNEAQQTYNTLKDFDRAVQASKNSAEEALTKIPEIQEMINEAVNKQNTAEKILKEAKQNAQTARDVAKQAQKEFAEEASTETEKIRSEAYKMRVTAGKLRDEAESLAGRVSITDLQLQKLENETLNNGSIIDEAKKKVNQASTDTKEASSKVAEVLKDIQTIIDELNDIPDIDPSDLNNLEEKLLKAENRLKEARLDDRMDSLKKERRDQSSLILNYKKEYEQLLSDVENIEQIVNALPITCHRSLELEP